jgi:hypothetical protein
MSFMQRSRPPSPAHQVGHVASHYRDENHLHGFWAVKDRYLRFHAKSNNQPPDEWIVVRTNLDWSGGHAL